MGKNTHSVRPDQVRRPLIRPGFWGVADGWESCAGGEARSNNRIDGPAAVSTARAFMCGEYAYSRDDTIGLGSSPDNNGLFGI